MQLETNIQEGVALIMVNATELDASNADDFKHEVGPILAEHSRVVLNLEPLRFIDSSGCGAILSCLKIVTTAGGDLKLCGAGKSVRTVFELIRLHRICEIVDTPEEAIRSFLRK